MSYHVFYASNFSCPFQMEILEELNNRLLHTGQQIFIDYKNDLYHNLNTFKEKFRSDYSEPESIVDLVSYGDKEKVTHYVFDQFKVLGTMSFSLKECKFTYVATKKPTFFNALTRKLFFFLLEKNCDQVICRDNELVAFFKKQCEVPVRLVCKRRVPLEVLDERRKSDLDLSFLTNSYVFTAKASLDDTIELFEYIRLGKLIPQISLFIHINKPVHQLKAFFADYSLPENVSIISQAYDFERYLLKSICFLDFSNVQVNEVTNRSLLMPLMNGVPIITCKDSHSAELVLPQYNGMILENHSSLKIVRIILRMLENKTIFDYFQHNALDRACFPMHYQTSKKIEIFDSI